jgi:hypothetical protein
MTFQRVRFTPSTGSTHRVLVSAQQGMVKRRHQKFIDQLVEPALVENSETPLSTAEGISKR